jgi:hypothetical protein
VLTGGGAVGSRSVSRLQQAHPAGAKHDAEGRGRLRSGFHSAHQCGKIWFNRILGLGPEGWILGPGTLGLRLRAWCLGPGSWVLEVNAWCLVSGTWCLVPEVWYLGPGSWVLGPGSWVLGPGSWVLGPGS